VAIIHYLFCLFSAEKEMSVSDKTGRICSLLISTWDCKLIQEDVWNWVVRYEAIAPFEDNTAIRTAHIKNPQMTHTVLCCRHKHALHLAANYLSHILL